MQFYKLEGVRLKVKLKERASTSRKCLKYGTTWNAHCRNDEGKGSKQKRKKSEVSIFYKFITFDRNPVFDFLQNERLRRLVKMIDFDSNENTVALDIGCGCGQLTRFLADQINGTVIGIDASKINLKWALGHPKTEFILSDINHLPFRINSIDMVVCASVLEHVKEIGDALKEIRNSMKNNGYLVAGYPIETNLFVVLVKLFRSDWMKIRDPKFLGKENFDRSPETHKQSFMTIRSLLQRQFIFICREKLFFNLPDAISWYECAKMKKRNYYAKTL